MGSSVGLHTVLSDNHSTTWGTLFSQGSQIPQTPRPSFQASVSLYIWGKSIKLIISLIMEVVGEVGGELRHRPCGNFLSHLLRE